MKSRTSFFNPGVFRKDVTRFAPMWALYCVFLLVLAMIVGGNSGGISTYGEDLWGTLPLMAFANCVYALICGQLLFGDLFQARMCNALHAMPMRRECWFFTHTAAGLAFSLVPNLVLALISGLLSPGCWMLVGEWWLASALAYLFFFGLAALCAFCSGSRFAMALCYGLVNFLAWLVYWLMDTLYVPLLYGFHLNADPFSWFCPVGKLITGELPLWGYLAVLTGIGVLLLGLALLLYRRRKLECAGDFITVRWLAPVFLVVYTLSVGAVFQAMRSVFLGLGDNRYLFLTIGMAVGFFTGKMLLDRTARVFRKKVLLAFGLFAVVLAGSMGLTRLDPLGLTDWVPTPSQVKQVVVRSNVATGVDRWTITDPEEIRAVLDIHWDILHGSGIREEEDGWGYEYGDLSETVRLDLEYKLANGGTAKRRYRFRTEDSLAGETFRKLLSQPDYLVGMDWDSFCETILTAQVEDWQVPREKLPEFLEAIRMDCEAGNMAQHWACHPDRDSYKESQENTVYWTELAFTNAEALHQRNYVCFFVFGDCVHTRAWLRENGFASEKYPDTERIA